MRKDPRRPTARLGRPTGAGDDYSYCQTRNAHNGHNGIENLEDGQGGIVKGWTCGCIRGLPPEAPVLGRSDTRKQTEVGTFRRAWMFVGLLRPRTGALQGSGGRFA